MKTKYKFICAIAIAVLLFAGSGIAYPAAVGSVYAETEASTVLISAPQRLKAVRAGDTSIKLSWNKSVDAAGYAIYRYNPKTKKYTAVKNLGKAALSWTNKKLKSDTVYSYKIRAFAKNGGKKVYSPYTYVVSATPYTKKSKKTNAKNIKVNLRSRFLGLNGVSKIRDINVIAANGKIPVNDKLVWTSSDTSMVTVDKDGWLKAKKKVGTVKVYVRSHNGITKTFKVKVGDYANPASFSNLDKLKPFDKKAKATIEKNKDAMCRVADYLSQSKEYIDFDWDEKHDYFGVDGGSIELEPIEQDLLQLLKNGFNRLMLIKGCVIFYLDSGAMIYYFDFNGSDKPKDGYIKLAPCWFFDMPSEIGQD